MALAGGLVGGGMLTSRPAEQGQPSNPWQLPAEASVGGSVNADGSIDLNMLQQIRGLAAAGNGPGVRAIDTAFMGGAIDPALMGISLPEEKPTVDAGVMLARRPEIHAVHGRLGAGNFGEVFHCTMVDQQQQVAVKVLHKGSDVSQKREVELLGQLRHANLVQCQLVLRGPPDALVLELCSGGTLDTLLHQVSAQSGAFTSLGLRPRARAMVDILAAVEYLHAQRIVHRDIKSGNAFLSSQVVLPAEELPPVKLGDLGLARELDSKMTQCTGTWRYMAPEVLNSDEYTESADIFSCGILLHEAMSGKVPFGNLNALRVAAAIATGQRPDVKDLPGPAPIADALAAVIQASWAEEPAERPSASYLAQCLQPLAA